MWCALCLCNCRCERGTQCSLCLACLVCVESGADTRTCLKYASMCVCTYVHTYACTYSGKLLTFWHAYVCLHIWWSSYGWRKFVHYPAKSLANFHSFSNLSLCVVVSLTFSCLCPQGLPLLLQCCPPLPPQSLLERRSSILFLRSSTLQLSLLQRLPSPLALSSLRLRLHLHLKLVGMGCGMCVEGVCACMHLCEWVSMHNLHTHVHMYKLGFTMHLYSAPVVYM